jgi:hypothetical protein
MFDAVRAAGWRNRYILPALRQAALRNPHVGALPDLMILVEFWLWAIFFRFSGDYSALEPMKQAKLRDEAFKLSFHDYKNVHQARMLELIKEMTPTYGLGAVKAANIAFTQLVRPTFEHSVIAAQRLAPLHETFDLAALRLVLSQVNWSFKEMPGFGRSDYDNERQYNLKLVAQVAAVGQAQLYAYLTGVLIPADTVLVEEGQIPDLVDVFVSYARADAGFVADLVSKFESSGVIAWYDQRIESDAQFDRVISDQIAAAKVVVVVWSPASIGSRWVRAEALAGFNADKLLQLRLGACEIPTPFNIVQLVIVGANGLTPEVYGPFIDTVRRKIGAV